VLDIDTLVGREVPVRIKHKPSKSGAIFVNAYIDLGSGNAPADADYVKRAVDKMASAPDDNIPF
jgi:hypothetical protein